MVTILPRSAWTSTPDARNDPLSVTRTVAITCHYPVGRNTKGWTRAQFAAALRKIREGHLARGWRDIGYNYAIDQNGDIWHLTGDDIGAHANVVGNTTSIGVVFLVGTTEEPTPELINAFRRFRAARLIKFPKATKVQGHQQVPGNSTACPGGPIMRLIRAGELSKKPGTTSPTPPTDKMDPAAYFIGAVGPHVTWLGHRLVLHGFGDHYNAGPGPTFTEADRLNVAAFQRAQGWSGDDADGFPGPETLRRILAAPPTTPPPPVDTTTVKVLFLPMAGYNADGQPGVTRYKANTRGLLSIVTDVKPDLVGTTELSNRAINPMRPLFDAGATAYQRVSGGSDGRYIYRRKSTTTHIASGHVLAADSTELNDDDKQAAWSVDEVDGVRVRTIFFHGENEDGVDRSGANKGANADNLRVGQAISVEQRALKAMSPYATEGPILYAGDFNSEGMVRDAMVARGWKVVGHGNFTGWADNVKLPLAWVFIKGGTATLRRIYHDYSDHTAIAITWTVPK